MSTTQIVLIVVAVAVVVVLGVGGLLVAILVPALSKAQEMANRAVCMSNLSSINKGLILYKAYSDDKYPWLHDGITTWDTATVATNRTVDPFGPNDDPKNPKARSTTALMFMLVRNGQLADIFRCPSDRQSKVDDETKSDQTDGDVKEGECYFDFSKPENVSYSYQAPLYVGPGKFKNGVDPSESETAIVADMTPRYGGSVKWTPIPIADNTPASEISKQLTNNHKCEQVNVLYIAGNVRGQKRPDVGYDNSSDGAGPDQIYTAFGNDVKSRRKATSTDIKDHKSEKDTFLIGPVGRAEGK